MRTADSLGGSRPFFFRFLPRVGELAGGADSRATRHVATASETRYFNNVSFPTRRSSPARKR